MKNLFLNQFSFHIYLIFQYWKKRMLEEVSHNKLQVRFWVFNYPWVLGLPTSRPVIFFFFVVFVIYEHNFFASLHLFFKVLRSYEVSDNNFTAWEVSKCGFFFWSVFSCIWTDYGDLRSIQENTDQNKLHIWILFTQCLWCGRENKKMLWHYFRTIFCFFCQQA